MDDDSRVIDKGWDALPEYGNPSGDADDAVTVSISTTPGEWLVNTVDAVVVPMSMAEVVDALQHHKLTERSLVWRAGMPEWAAVDKVPQLKLAARMPLTRSNDTPRPQPPPAAGAPPPAVVAPVTASKPPPKPVRVTPPPQAPRPASVAPQSIPSRKATLPFGLPTATAGQSRPSNPRASSPRLAVPPQASSDEPEVLAVYTRPAATISFDLAPVEPRRSTTTAPPTPPQTLAPLTTDSAQRRGPTPRNADLSVVAASDFRQVQRSSQRLVLLSSLASAAAASLLTFVLSRGGSSNAPTAPVPGTALATQPVAAPALNAAPVNTPLSPEPVNAAPELTPEPEPTAAAPKPKARKARAVSAARPAPPKAEPSASTRDAASEPNPYDVKLEEEPPAAKPEAEADGDAPQASSNGSASPGF